MEKDFMRNLTLYFTVRVDLFGSVKICGRLTALRKIEKCPIFATTSLLSCWSKKKPKFFQKLPKKVASPV